MTATLIKIKNPVYRSSHPESAYYYGPIDKDLYVKRMRAAALHAVEKLARYHDYYLTVDEKEEHNWRFHIPDMGCFVDVCISTTYFMACIGKIFYDLPNKKFSSAWGSVKGPTGAIDMITRDVGLTYYEAKLISKS